MIILIKAAIVYNNSGYYIVVSTYIHTYIHNE